MRYELINSIDKDLTPTEQILLNRGIKKEDIYHYLHTTFEDDLSPLLLDNMDKGAKLLLKHLLNNSKIHIFVDSDMDGFGSSALLLNYLHEWIPSIVDNNITYSFHEGKQHGIDVRKVSEDVSLVIAPDSSSDEPRIHNFLDDRGVDVLVLDHHNSVGHKFSPACIINNQLCDYPTKSLCGTAIVYKFCQYLDILLGVDNSKKYIDLVALTLISDMMDLRDFETHYFVENGLMNINNPFFKLMIDKDSFHFGDTVTPMGIAFYVAPFVNAINRSGTQEEKKLVFDSMLEWKAYDRIPSTKRGFKGTFEERVEQAVRTCTNVKNRQTRIQDSMVDQIEEFIEENQLLEHKILVVPFEEKVDSNLIGLVANKLASQYKKPTMVLRKNEERNSWAGSARNIVHPDFDNFRQFCLDSEKVNYAAGHDSAFGIEIEDEELPNFIKYSDKKLEEVEFTPDYMVDFIYDYSTVDGKDILEIGRLKSLWGQNISEALIAIENIVITKDNLTLMSRNKNPTLKIELPGGVTCIKFKSSEEEYDLLYSESGCVVINVIGKCNLNEFNGNITPQILIENYEIVSNQEYYF